MPIAQINDLLLFWHAMLDDATSPDETPLPQVPISEPAELEPDSKSVPWVTGLACGVCVAIYFGLTVQTAPQSAEVLAKFGALSADQIWDGAVWGLITSAFVHLELWHLAFNLYWLWLFGSRIERAVGSLRFLGLILAAAFVSSGMELGVSGNTGIGMSGVDYALFGFLWVAREHHPPFREVLSRKVIQLFVAWLFVSVFITLAKILNVGNVAHFSGLLFGAAVSAGWFIRYKPRLMLAGVFALVVLTIGSLFWCPWSVPWLRHKAYAAHVAEKYDSAIELYTRIIEHEPKDPWAYLNRSSAFTARGELDNAQADLKKAQNLGAVINEETR